MVAERKHLFAKSISGCSLAKISMVAELVGTIKLISFGCSLAKISMVAELSLRR